VIRRFVLALASVLALAISVATPAWANPPQAGPLSATPAPDAYGVIASTDSPTIAGEFHMKSGGVVKAVAITIKYTGTTEGVAPTTVKVCGGGGSTPSCGGSEAKSFSKAIGPLAVNGPYEIGATATGTDPPVLVNPDETGTATPITVKLRVAPAAPANVKAIANDAGNAVTVSWDRNSEPDVTTYVPVRQNANGSFTRLKYLTQPPANQTRVTMKDDSLGAGGELKYYVYALRSAGEKGIDAIRSNVSAEAKVKVASVEPPSTTTTTVAGGGGGPAGGGGTATTVPRPPPTVPVPTAADLKIGSLPAPIISHGRELGKVGNATGNEVGGINVDDGAFNEALPYGAGTKNGTPGSSGRSTRALPLRGTTQGSSTKALLIPLSAGAALCVVAFQLRFLNGRVIQPVDLA
jgi:hypothetical protein